MRVLVIGAGSIGRRHLSNLRAMGVDELAATDPSPEALAAAVADTAGLAAFPALDDAWGWTPDAVVVTSPTSMHIDHAMAALRNGCDLFVEKPVAAEVDGVAALIGEADEREAITMVGCNLRFHPGVAEVKRVVESGVLGSLVSARIEFGEWLPDWRPGTDYRTSYSAKRALGGGVVLDAIHEIDYAMWLFGDPVEVAGFAGSLSSLGLEVEDTADFIMRFEAGPIASVHMDYVQRVYSRACRVAGSDGTVIWDWHDDAVSVYSAGTGQWARTPLPSGWDKNEMYMDEMRHFVDCCATRRASVNPLAAAARTLEVALSIGRG